MYLPCVIDPTIEDTYVSVTVDEIGDSSEVTWFDMIDALYSKIDPLKVTMNSCLVVCENMKTNDLLPDYMAPEYGFYKIFRISNINRMVKRADSVHYPTTNYLALSFDYISQPFGDHNEWTMERIYMYRQGSGDDSVARHTYDGMQLCTTYANYNVGLDKIDDIFSNDTNMATELRLYY